MNNQNENRNDIDSNLVKDKYRTSLSEATEDTKKGKRKSRIIKPQYHFKDSLQYHNTGLILILTGLKKTL